MFQQQLTFVYMTFDHFMTCASSKFSNWVTCFARFRSNMFQTPMNICLGEKHKSSWRRFQGGRVKLKIRLKWPVFSEFTGFIIYYFSVEINDNRDKLVCTTEICIKYTVRTSHTVFSILPSQLWNAQKTWIQLKNQDLEKIFA